MRLSVALFLLLTLAMAKEGRKAASRPNIVIFFPDETRAESLGTYGHKLTKTPNYDELARQGTLFKQAHVLHTQCSPSRCAMITGRYLHTLGHRTQTHLVQSWEDNYFRVLKDSGYHVAWFGKNDMFSQDAFAESVSQWSEVTGVAEGSNLFKKGESGYFSFLNSASESSANDTTANGDLRAVSDAIDFLANDPPQPFVLFLPIVGAHPPYGAPKEYYDMYDPTDVRLLSPLRNPDLPKKPLYHSSKHGIPKFRNLTGIPNKEDVMYKINAVYLGRVSYTDHLFGMLMAALQPWLDTTAVIVSSDHGDFAGDYHLVEKWPGGLDDVLTRVPLIMRVPGGKQGAVVETPVNSFDVMETVAELASVQVPWTRFARSLLDILKRGEEVVDENKTVYCEGGFYYDAEIEPNDPSQKRPAHDPHDMYYPRFQEELDRYPDGSPRAVMARTRRWKLVYRPRGVSELYDLSADPRELANVYDDPSYGAVRQEMEGGLLRWMVLTSDVTPLKRDPRPAPQPPPEPPAAPFKASPVSQTLAH